MTSRLDQQPLEWIDRSESCGFEFEGRHYTGYRGDSITSALLAAGQTLLGRSFKYHRPRGAVTLANHDVNALFQSSEEPNIRGDVTALEAISPAIGNQLSRILLSDLIARFFFQCFCPVIKASKVF